MMCVNYAFLLSLSDILSVSYFTIFILYINL